jgi:hypothetical protein
MENSSIGDEIDDDVLLIDEDFCAKHHHRFEQEQLTA